LSKNLDEGKWNKMTKSKIAERKITTKKIQEIGNCLELVSIDPNFQNITVGLYVKESVFTVWTFSKLPGANDRIEQIRNRLVTLGDLQKVENIYNQARFSCGELHDRPMKFLIKHAVEKSPDFKPAAGGIKDLRSPLIIDLKTNRMIDPGTKSEKWTYTITHTGDAPNPPARIRTLAGGMVKYGEMEKISDDTVSFQCGHNHTLLAKLVLPYARNVSAVEDMLDADAQRGQMNTSTLGFTPPT